jgi:glycosyltransferase involved in cell wall biosynthesis
MRRLVIVCDHPSLHRGFSIVGSHLARHLHATRRWNVRYLGRFPRAADAPAEPYPVFDADPADDGGDGDGRQRHLLRTLLDEGGADAPPLVLSIGSPSDQRVLVDRLDELALRSRLRLVSYLPVDFTPVTAAAAELCRRVDVLVPYTEFGARAVRDALAGSPLPRVAAPIAHGVDLETFHPLDADRRTRARAELFGLEPGDLLIGFFGRNSGHKRADLALRIFAAFAAGRWVRCFGCRRVTAHEIDCFGAPEPAPAACPACGDPRLMAGDGCARAALYLHTELLGRRERVASGGWDLEAIARRLGVRDRVRFDPALRVGHGVEARELARRMGACDLHLLPYEAGGWELTVLETGACGVPNVITGTAAPPEYASAFSEVVPPATRLSGPAGDREIIDLGRAVEVLERLAGDPGRRQELGSRGVEVAAAHSWARIGRSWDHLLSSVAG